MPARASWASSPSATTSACSASRSEILFDEKFGGTIHLALGAGYPDTGSVNKSSVHWDLICDMRRDSEITVDGSVFYKDGAFKV